jgi:hypothetical protein
MLGLLLTIGLVGQVRYTIESGYMSAQVPRYRVVQVHGGYLDAAIREARFQSTRGKDVLVRVRKTRAMATPQVIPTTVPVVRRRNIVAAPLGISVQYRTVPYSPMGVITHGSVSFPPRPFVFFNRIRGSGGCVGGVCY